MTVEEALIFLLAVAAGIFLFLGLAQVLDSRPPRVVRARGRSVEFTGRGGPRVTVPADARSPGQAAPQTPTEASIGLPPLPGLSSPVLPAEPVGGAGPSLMATPGAGREPVGDARLPEARLPRGEHVGRDADLAFVEDCIGLGLGGRHEELLAAVMPYLEQCEDAGPAAASHTVTALWSLAGLARHGQGDAAGARTAFAAAVRSRPRPASASCPPRLAALSVSVARRLLEASEPAPDETDERRTEARMQAGRLAAFWLNWRLVAAPGDQGAVALLDAAQDAVAEGHAETATALIRRQEFAEARRLVQRALEVGELPAARGEVLLEFLAVALRREIDRLTAAAVRGSKDESRAVAGLGRAEALLQSMPDGALPPARRAAIARRVWRAHSKLGFRRLRLGQLDAAADTLLHALEMQEIGRRPQRQVRDALVRTLEAMGERGTGTVAAGDRATAAVEVARLKLLTERARKRGVSAEELEVVSTRTRQLDQLAGAPAPGEPPGGEDP